MAASKKQKKETTENTDNVQQEVDDVSVSLIRDLNKHYGMKVAYNLAEDTAPTIVKRWIPTGSTQLDYIISNRRSGGLPEGRLIELSGMPSNGKSHIVYETARNVQKMNGLVVYIDTENATPVEKLGEMGIDIRKRFVYCDTHVTEEVFDIIEKTIEKAKQILAKNVPILVVWDSVAATSPKAEIEGEYTDNTMGLQARVISKCMRKIIGVIGSNNITFIAVNQLREKIGCVSPETKLTVRRNKTN